MALFDLQNYKAADKQYKSYYGRDYPISSARAKSFRYEGGRYEKHEKHSGRPVRYRFFLIPPSGDFEHCGKKPVGLNAKQLHYERNYNVNTQKIDDECKPWAVPYMAAGQNIPPCKKGNWIYDEEDDFGNCDRIINRINKNRIGLLGFFHA